MSEKQSNQPDASVSVAKREEMIRQVDHVMKTSGCVVDFDGLMNKLEKIFPGYDIGRLIFDPPSGKKMTAEEIVDEALRGSES